MESSFLSLFAFKTCSFIGNMIRNEGDKTMLGMKWRSGRNKMNSLINIKEVEIAKGAIDEPTEYNEEQLLKDLNDLRMKREQRKIEPELKRPNLSFDYEKEGLSEFEKDRLHMLDILWDLHQKEQTSELTTEEKQLAANIGIVMGVMMRGDS